MLLIIKAYCALHEHWHQQNLLLREMGWSYNGMDVPQEQREQKCDHCDACFATQAALAVHQQKVHGMCMAMRRFAKDGVCRCCSRNFHTRPRLLRHLHWGTTPCWVFHLRAFRPLTDVEAAELDLIDIQKGHATHQQGLRSTDEDRL